MAINGNDERAVFFGRTNFRGTDKIFGVKTVDRRQHMYVVGKTGTGKTTLIKNLAAQDIQQGRGLCVVDPHGELVEELLEQIPPERARDVVYFNPADTEYPLGFNVLEAPNKQYTHLVAQGLIGIFTKIWANVWSARMEYILQNCILALIETPGTTLLGIQRILVDKDYRQRILANVTDPVVNAFWVNEYETWREQFRNEAIVPIQNKVGQFVSTALIRNIVGQTQSSFDMFDLMNERKILLANISKGRIGEENSALLGAMLITKVQLAAMERVRISEEKRQDFYLYVDEFQNFATEAFASILSEARKYRLNLIIAHQYIGQLVTETTTKVRDAVFGNVGTMVVFRVGATDAEFLEKEFFPEFTAQDLVCLPNRCVYLKLMVNGVTSRPFSASTLPPLQRAGGMARKEGVITVSRGQYARSREDVEQEIKRWSSGLPGEAGVAGAKAGARPGSGQEKFESPCWTCAKTAITPFKPDPTRPVYCIDCLKKVEAGTLKPMRPLPGRKNESFAEDSLGALGIEFSGQDAALGKRKTGAEVGPARELQTSRIHQPARRDKDRENRPLREGELVSRNAENQAPVSLRLLSGERRALRHHDEKAQLEELRKTLKNVLGNSTDMSSLQPRKSANDASGSAGETGLRVRPSAHNANSPTPLSTSSESRHKLQPGKTIFLS